jgi:SAM-dependent methyltransferase
MIVKYITTISSPPSSQEGFSQDGPFLLKRDGGIYDEFYSDIYDNLYDTTNRCQWSLLQIINITEPSTKFSNFLDIGSGTGYVVNELQNAGFQVFGVERSPQMVKYSEKKYPDVEIKCGDARDPMIYDRMTFTHILCMNMTIYEFPDKYEFFRNCYQWLVPNGFLVLHLIEPKKFRRNFLLKNNGGVLINPLLNLFNRSKTVDTIIQYDDYTYTNYFQFSTDDPKMVVLKETFIDNQTKNIRQNENTLYMVSIEDIMKIASNAGFISHSKVDMNSYNDDENQYLVVFERSM